MQRKRTVVIRCRWGSIPQGWRDPPAIPDDTLRAMFSGTPSKWGVAQLWHDATIGKLEFAPTELIDVGPLRGLALTATPGGGSTNPNRTMTVNAAISAATATGFRFEPNDVPVVMIGPPPCDAGAVGSAALGRTACLLDVDGDQSFMAHEFGHALGFDHSFGPAFGDPEAEYCDPYCVMSHNIYGYRAPWANGIPPEWPVSPGLPEGWTVQMGPLPAAATVWKYLPDFASSPSVVNIDLTRQPAAATLVSYGTATSPSNMVLAVAKTPGRTWLVEYRGAHGWDRGIGLGPKLNPAAGGNYDPTPPGVVIHRLNAAGRVVFMGVIDSRAGAGQVWRATDDNFEVSLTAIGPDGSWAALDFGPPHLNARRLGEQTSPYGAALVSVGRTFVNEDHYVGWTGTANLRPNFARSDNTFHQQAREDTANGHLALTTDGRSIWGAWSGTNPAHSLNLFTGPPSQAFARKIFRPGDSSPTGPAVAMLGGRLVLAYMTEEGAIHVVPGADDPQAPAHRVEEGATIAGPAITAFAGVLYLAWASDRGGGIINVVSSRDGVTWANRWSFATETTRFAPAILGADPRRIYLAWTGTNGAQSLNLGMIDAGRLESPNPQGALDGKVVFPVSSVGAPALAPTTTGYDLFLAWAGTDGPGNLYTAYLIPFPGPPPSIH
jgi:hypothetical protein